MKKVLFFIESLGGGGAEKVLLDIVKNVDKNIYDITVITATDFGVYNKEISRFCNYKTMLSAPKSKVSTIIYKIKYKLIYKLPSKLVYKIFIRDKYDIEVGFIEGFSTKIIGSSTNRYSKKISWVHVDPIERPYADNYYKNIKQHVDVYNRFSNIICVSESVAKSFKKKYSIEDNILIKYNPIDKNSIKIKSTEICPISKPNKILIGAIGRLSNQKGFDRLLRVVKRLKKEGLEFELWILGEGEERGRLQEYIDRNKLKDSVKLLGFDKNPYKYICKFDIFVCSSRSEGFSLAIAEAMTLHIPVISTDCSGPNELLNFGEYGLLVDNNEKSLYEGIKKLILDKDLRYYYKEKSLIRSEFFDLDNTINNIEKALQ